MFRNIFSFLPGTQATQPIFYYLARLISLPGISPIKSKAYHIQDKKSMKDVVTIQFWENYHAAHVSFARTVSYVHLPEALSIMNCILLPKTE
jgi:hypothetical protein